jgi:hypothetical protein
MTEPKDEAKQDINPPKTGRIGNDFREGPNPSPGGTIDTGDSLIPPYEDRTGGVTSTNEQDTPAQALRNCGEKSPRPHNLVAESHPTTPTSTHVALGSAFGPPGDPTLGL